MHSWLLFHCWPCMGCLPRPRLFPSMHALVNWRIKAFELLIESLKRVSMNSRPWRAGRSGRSKQISPARFFSSVLTTNWRRCSWFSRDWSSLPCHIWEHLLPLQSDDFVWFNVFRVAWDHGLQPNELTSSNRSISKNGSTALRTFRYR